jgi:hypothetical protein
MPNVNAGHQGFAASGQTNKLMVSISSCFVPLFHLKTTTMSAHSSKQKLLLIVFSFLIFGASFKAKAGLDSYEIYLNNKLILKQSVNQPLSLESLGLNQSNINDQLVIHYSQCNAPGKLGKGRSILVKDAKGNTLKKWNFADAKDGLTGMEIAVKELLQLEKKAPFSTLSLYYTAEGRAGQLLANFHFGNKNTTYHKKQRSAAESMQVRASFILSALFFL